MTASLLRYVLALGLAGAFAVAALDSAEAAKKRSGYKTYKPRHAYVVRPYVERHYVREPGCATMYDNRGVALPDHMNPNCENAFRRLYPPR